MRDHIVARDQVLKTGLMVAAVVICIRLGVWQLDRLAERRAYNLQVVAAQKMPPLNLPSTQPLAGQEYRAVRAVGTYDFGKQVALRNQVHEGQHGYHLITPLLFDEQPSTSETRSAAVLVDRGWIPAGENGSEEDWREYDEPGRVAVEGVIRAESSAPSYAGALPVPTGSPAGDRPGFWMSIDIAKLAEEMDYSLLPIYIVKTPAGDTPQPPIAVVSSPNLQEGPHLWYAIQWFGIAASLIAGHFLHARMRSRQDT